MSWWRSSHVLSSGTAALACGLHDAFFGLAEQVEAALGEEIEREGKAGGAPGEDAVVNVAATGEVSDEGRGLLPHLAPAARVLIVAVGQVLARDQPEALDEKNGEQHRRDALRQVEMESAEAGEPVGHHDQESKYQSKWLRRGGMNRGQLRAGANFHKARPHWEPGFLSSESKFTVGSKKK